jgi:hypothetical protein
MCNPQTGGHIFNPETGKPLQEKVPMEGAWFLNANGQQKVQLLYF